MVGETGFFSVWLWGLIGYAAMICAENLLRPRPNLKRPYQSWLVSFGLWGILYSILTLITGRPICSMAGTIAFAFLLIIVSNAKYKSLREPFLFQDYDYFLDTLRFPRLFLPFLGLKSFFLAALMFAIAIAGFMAEQPPAGRWELGGQAGAAMALVAFSTACLLIGAVSFPQPVLDPVRDLKRFGLFAFLWSYFAWSRPLPKNQSIFSHLSGNRTTNLPHLVAIQSESFFDPRQLWPGIHENLLTNLDKFSEASFLDGMLEVPAWGANTERSEFSFLTGMSERELGAHRFNPYQALSRGWKVAALPFFLQSLGYQTICIHPYYKAFYGRDRNFPALGFDAFVDQKNFSEKDRDGFYVGDVALGSEILKIIRQADKPLFIFAITMENHGPLHMEPPVAPEIIQELFDKKAPAECLELPAYLRHQRNADQMLGMLWDGLCGNKRSASLCFYGDHVPIMPASYASLGEPAGEVPYFCWSPDKSPNDGLKNMKIENLACAWLSGLGII